MVFHRNARIVDRGSLCSVPEYTGSKLQNDPYLCSVACSKTELSILGEKLGEQVKDRSPEKPKIVHSGSICNAPDSTGSKLQYEPHLFSEACSQTELSISG